MTQQQKQAIYRAIQSQEHPVAQAARDWLQRTHQGLRTYVDPAWDSLLRNDPSAAFWELFLAASLRSAAHDLIPKLESRGPDLGVVVQPGLNLSIEAASAEAGDPATNDDHVPELPPGIASRVPHDLIALRIVQALSRKDKAIARYRAQRLIGEFDPVVIAINGWEATNWRGDSNPSYVERACLGVGGFVYEVERRGGIVARFLESKRSIRRASGAERSTTFFADPENPRSHISAVIFATNQICGHTGLSGERLGSELVILHNPRAAKLLPDDFLRVGHSIRVVTDPDGRSFVERRNL